MRRIFLFLSAALLLLVPNAGFADGKAGLWSVTTTYQFGMPLVPPALVALSRAQNLKTPVTGTPFVHHICMTIYEADGRQPPHLNSYDLDCVGRVVRQRGPRMLMENICHGPLEGVGHAQIVWQGDRHFEGSYDFKGKFRGDSAWIKSSFSADWQDDNCRGVRPFIPPNN
ncbi:MAG TPA: hypothetical protein VFI23_06970 [Rhizomicrobium sp.]|nr:hypothetical protein [Rhizomicrobium sp.]